MQSFPGRKAGDVRAVIAAEPTIRRTSHGAIEYAATGRGPAVLAIHGVLGGYDQGLILARSAFTDSGSRRVIAVSRPGYLGTPLSSGRSPEQQADLYAALLHRLKIERAMVIAISGGGPSAIRFALRHPQRCAGIIMVSACTGRLTASARVRRRIPMVKIMARLPWVTRYLRWRIDRNPVRAARRSIRDEAVIARTLAHPDAGPLLRALQSSVMDRLAARLPGTLNDMEHFAVLAPLPIADIEAPILAIHGERDRVVPFDHGRRVADLAPDAELLPIGDAGHVALFTNMDEIRASVRAFMERDLSPKKRVPPRSA